MLNRYTTASMALLALTIGACGPDQSRLEEEAREAIEAFQTTAETSLQSIDAQLDTARQRLDSLSGDVQERTETTLDELAARRDRLEQRIRMLAWEGETQWDSTTSAIENELNRLRADIAAAIAPGEAAAEMSAGDGTARVTPLASGRLR